MAIHTITIDGFIGPYGYSKQFIRNQLAAHKKDQVVIKISSLGGNVDDALSIFDQFKEHGNITAELSAFVASSATIISLGANRVRMNENSFYLIHKAMDWVDEWGTLNEDEIESLIEKLEKSRQQLSKVTLQLAKMYMAKTGKSLEEIISLMKQNSWLNAQEALEWGFVDEIIESTVIENYLDDLQMVALITSNGMPVPPRKKEAGKPDVETIDKESLFAWVWNRLKGKQAEENLSVNNTKQMKKQFLNVNKVLGVESLESNEEGVFLNETHLQAIEERLSLDQQIVTERDDAIAERDTAVTERDAARTEFSNATGLIDAIDPVIAAAQTPEAKVAAIRSLLSAKPGENPAGNLETGDPAGGSPKDIDWDTIDSLPHNRQVDSNL